MRREEMLPRWFINDTANTGTWRIKGHAASDFWRWVASWARCVSMPSDLGFSDDGYVLPGIAVAEHMVKADRSIDAGFEGRGKFVGQQRLFRMPDTSATAIHKEKRLTNDDRADLVAECIDGDPKSRGSSGAIPTMRPTRSWRGLTTPSGSPRLDDAHGQGRAGSTLSPAATYARADH
jgi:hypothetical protein